MDYKIQRIEGHALTEKLCNDIYTLTHSINDTYSGHDQWLAQKFFPGFENGSRKMIIALDGQQNLAGCVLLIDTVEEKKICCLFIRKDCRGYGIASKLIQESLVVLDTDKPQCTVSDKNYKQLHRLFEINGFKFSYRKKGAYKESDTEYYFNNEATEILKNKVLTPLFMSKLQNKRQ